MPSVCQNLIFLFIIKCFLEKITDIKYSSSRVMFEQSNNLLWFGLSTDFSKLIFSVDDGQNIQRSKYQNRYLYVT